MSFSSLKEGHMKPRPRQTFLTVASAALGASPGAFAEPISRRATGFRTLDSSSLMSSLSETI